MLYTVTYKLNLSTSILWMPSTTDIYFLNFAKCYTSTFLKAATKCRTTPNEVR